jgi:hypothetical protein
MQKILKIIYNDFERLFAEFLNRERDVLRFASLGTTEQGDSVTQLRVDNIKPSGAAGFYRPELRREASWHDSLVQFSPFRDEDGVEVNIVLEKAGKVAGVEIKAAATVMEKDFRGLKNFGKRPVNDFPLTS